MAEIASYQCTNNKCRFAVRLSREMPIWHAETPHELKKLSVSPEARPFVIKYRSELFCHICRKITEHQGTLVCAECGTTDLYEEQAGRSCAQCSTGVFEMTRLIVY